jgi:hypothetical protein
MDTEEQADRFILDLVPREAFNDVWPYVQLRLMNMADRSRGEMTIRTIAYRIGTGHWQLWLVTEGKEVAGCVITEIGAADSGMKICTVKACIGEDATRWLHLLSEIEEWARANGCQRINAWARRGWAKRLPHYEMTHVLLERDL